MTDERKTELTTRLYETASHEFDVFLRSMKAQTTEYIIDHAYELSVKQDMVMLLEEHNFPPQELEILAALEHPLDVIYSDWLQRDDSRMEDLGNTFEHHAVQKLQAQAEQLHADPTTPRYPCEYRESAERGEVCLFRASRDRDMACLKAFDKGISDANANQAMRPFIQKWTAEYGHDRCKFILGYSVQRADWDKRYSEKARQDAARYDYRITKDRDPHLELSTNAHPCLVNYAYELLMEQEQSKQKPPRQKNEPER